MLLKVEEAAIDSVTSFSCRLAHKNIKVSIHGLESLYLKQLAKLYVVDLFSLVLFV